MLLLQWLCSEILDCSVEYDFPSEYNIPRVSVDLLKPSSSTWPNPSVDPPTLATLQSFPLSLP